MHISTVMVNKDEYIYIYAFVNDNDSIIAIRQRD